MSIDTLTQQAAQAGQWRRENPEGLSVLVVTSDPAIAREVAWDLAAILHPDRVIGEVLYVGEPEQLVNVTGVEVVVRDRGSRL